MLSNATTLYSVIGYVLSNVLLNAKRFYAKTCYSMRISKKCYPTQKVLSNAKNVIRKSVTIHKSCYPTRKRFIQRKNLLSNAETCRPTKKYVIQRESVLFNAKTVLCENVISYAKSWFPAQKQVIRRKICFPAPERVIWYQKRTYIQYRKCVSQCRKHVYVLHNTSYQVRKIY